MMDFVTHNWTDEVVLSLPGRVNTAAELRRRLETAGITVRNVVMNLYGYDGGAAAYVEKMGSLVVLSQQKRDIPAYQWAGKKILDIVGGIVGCIFCGLIFIVIAPIIYKQSPGPIIFKQQRVGRNGKVFNMYKFRSMYMDAEDRKAELMKLNKVEDGMMFKMDDDPRIIGSEKKDQNGKPKGIGNFIRNTSLDEFPQFFNVLKGDMSLVGTRPPTLDEWAKYSEHHRKRLSMRPGITGLWQVSGRSEITDFEKVVELDSRYIDTWTVWMDIQILLRTVGKVLKREGAE
jgi:lipopolysaccharide/colanic/teichoic acid biosynthesis glycosyltransferase